MDPIAGKALETLVSAVTQVVFDCLVEETDIAANVRAWLGKDPARLTFQTALARAYTAFVRRYPRWAASLLDQTFLIRDDVAVELAKLLTRHGHPDPAAIAHA